MNLNEFEKQQISNFLINKRSDLTQEEKSQIASFINSKIIQSVKSTISEEEKKHIVAFVNKEIPIEKSPEIITEPTPKKKKITKIDINSIVEIVLQKIKSDNVFIESIYTNIPTIIPSLNKDEILTLIKSDNDFITSLIGEKGNDGQKGDKGDSGEPGKDAEIDYEKLTTDIINRLKEDVAFITTLKSMGQIAYSGGGLGYANVMDLIKTYSTGGGAISGSYVSDINGLNNSIVLSATGTNSIVQVGNTIIVSGTGGSGTVSGSYVRTIDGLSGDVLLSAGNNININKVGNIILISSSGSSVSAGVGSLNSLSGDINIIEGSNINISSSGNSIIISTSATGSGNSYFPSGW